MICKQRLHLMLAPWRLVVVLGSLLALTGCAERRRVAAPVEKLPQQGVLVSGTVADDRASSLLFLPVEGGEKAIITVVSGNYRWKVMPGTYDVFAVVSGGRALVKKGVSLSDAEGSLTLDVPADLKWEADKETVPTG
ncbi:hypothetical protein Pan216_48640 [Planctomycetes bacterium Pan216]|uniref:Uncharacterized protein n=1 Tax=Kolteria novifilia TaxID=2527975 RepID=A0A518BAP1_9BACT|nr:hypothetical protein Pan216_48640 [Planctomycetes bacterium Pan216]